MNNLYQEIKRFVNQDKLTIFVGAGVSRLSGFPSWSDLVKEMAVDLGFRDFRKKNRYPNSDELLTLPQMYYDNKGEAAYTAIVQRCIGDTQEPNEIHDRIMALKPRHILTTNYDHLLEKAAVKAGRNYSVVSSDAAVSQVATPTYLIKLHGELSGKFVLKEKDFLNYEHDFLLIDHLIKSIFATNLVLFIGYGLNDYNVRLIMNWVQNAQRGSFIRPIFLRTEKKPLTAHERKYQEGRGLRVIDNPVEMGTDDYPSSYREPLDRMLHDNYHRCASTELATLLDYLFGKVSGIQNLSYITRADFDYLFAPDYTLTESREIHLSSGTTSHAFLEYFTNRTAFNMINSDQTDVIDRFVQREGILGMVDDSRLLMLDVEIRSDAFWSKFVALKKLADDSSYVLTDRFRQAYALAQLCHYEQSYWLFTDLLMPLKEAQQWDLYYLVQINRRYLYFLVNTQRLWHHGLYSKAFLDELDRTVAFWKDAELFAELPASFRQTYRFLASCATANAVAQESIMLLEDKLKAELAVTRQTTYWGLSTYDKIKLNALEKAKFFYENMLMFSEFTELKIYIKNSLLTWVRAYAQETFHKREGFWAGISNFRYSLTTTDLLLVAKTFSYNEIRHLDEACHLGDLPFSEQNQLAEYLQKQIIMAEGIISEDSRESVILLRRYLPELYNLLYLAALIVTDESLILTAIRFLVKQVLPIIDNDVRIGTLWKMAVSPNAALALEESLLERFMRPLPSQQDDALPTRILVKMLRYSLKPNNQLVRLSGYIKANTQNADNQDDLTPLVDILYVWLDAEAQSILTNRIKALSIVHLDELMSSHAWPYSADETIKTIIGFMDQIKVSIEAERCEQASGHYAIHALSNEELLLRAGSILLAHHWSDQVKIQRYIGLVDEFDFLLSPATFDMTKVEAKWFLHYGDCLLGILAQNRLQRDAAITVLAGLMEDRHQTSDTLRKAFHAYKVLCTNIRC